ncbi:Demethylrebeccamycin-D-glucose O-methyltransferase [bacterium HR39]|nr:Demethylrebeccamycin-D-glucose O-methyltransferase [bacterium HR39]
MERYELEHRIRTQYAREGLAARLLEALRARGRDPGRLSPEDLAGFEDMHAGGRAATESVAALLAPKPGSLVLDVGSGLGGPARYVARTFDCRVVGVDITPELVEAARVLTERVGLADRVEFRVASALDLPFESRSFDAAFTIHVGMNIADKERFYCEIGRVLKPDTWLVIYDLFHMGGEIDYPMPWAEDESASFLLRPDELDRLLTRLGYEVVSIRNRTRAAAEAMRESARRAARTGRDEEAGSPPLVMGPHWREKVANLASALSEGRLGAYEFLVRRVGVAD